MHARGYTNDHHHRHVNFTDQNLGFTIKSAAPKTYTVSSDVTPPHNLFLSRRRRWSSRCRTPQREWSYSLRDWLSPQYHMLLLVKWTQTLSHTLQWLDFYPVEWLYLHNLARGYHGVGATDFISMTTPWSQRQREGRSRRWRRRMMIEQARGNKHVAPEARGMQAVGGGGGEEREPRLLRHLQALNAHSWMNENIPKASSLLLSPLPSLTFFAVLFSLHLWFLCFSCFLFLPLSPFLSSHKLSFPFLSFLSFFLPLVSFLCLSVIFSLLHLSSFSSSLFSFHVSLWH